MKRTLGTGALLVVTAMSAACGFKVLEDIGSDPHPPAVTVIGLVHYVAPPPEAASTDSAASSKQGRTVAWDSGGFSLSTGQKFYIVRSFSDVGGDILKFRLRDKDGPTAVDLTPTGQTYFSGTSGTLPEMIVDPATNKNKVPDEELIEFTGILGVHRLEFWAEDSHGSRSEKVEFIITMVP